MARSSDRINENIGGDTLFQLIKNRSATVGVIGLGYVGLPTMVAAAKAGYQVVGIDISDWRSNSINAGESYVEDIPSNVLSPLVESNRVWATTDYTALLDTDIIIVCVPTPVDHNKVPELGPLNNALDHIALYIKRQQLIILQSTTFPGTTEEIALSKLQSNCNSVGRDFFLAFSPERIDPGNTKYSMANIPKVVGGVTPSCTEIATAFLSTFIDNVIPVSSPKVAEMTKLLENIFRSVNIALVNELSELCNKFQIDIWEVIKAASTKPFGFMPFYPGIGVGGHCIPVDPFYLSWKAKEYDFKVNFIDIAAETNDKRPKYIASQIMEILSRHNQHLNNVKILLLGVSFKKDIGDIRNAPALTIAQILNKNISTIAYNDPHVPEIYMGNEKICSSPIDEAMLKSQSAVIILVDHSSYDLDLILSNSKLVIDTRNLTGDLGVRPNVIKL